LSLLYTIYATGTTLVWMDSRETKEMYACAGTGFINRYESSIIGIITMIEANS